MNSYKSIFNIKLILFFTAILSIIIIFLDNILGNLTMKNISFIFLMYLNLFIPLTLEFVKNK